MGNETSTPPPFSSAPTLPSPYLDPLRPLSERVQDDSLPSPSPFPASPSDPLATLGFALLRAARANDLAAVAQLLEDGAPAEFSTQVNPTGLEAYEEQCPLLWAVHHDNSAMAKKLIMYGAPLEMPVGDTRPIQPHREPNHSISSSSSSAPTTSSSSSSSSSTSSSTTHSNLSSNHLNSNTRLLSHQRTVFSHTFLLPSSAMLELFLQHGARPNLSITAPLRTATTRGALLSTALCDLLRHNARPSHALALLHYGADPCAPFQARYAHKRGLHVDASMTPLYLALVYVAEDDAVCAILQKLLSCGALPNAPSRHTKHVRQLAGGEEGRGGEEENDEESVVCIPCTETPLHAAQKRGNPRLIQILLDAGADPSIQPVQGEPFEFKFEE